MVLIFPTKELYRKEGVPKTAASVLMVWLLPARVISSVKTINLGLIAVISYLCASFTNADTILVHGDSLSAGYGMLPEDSWVTLLGVELATDYTVVNSSISGETTKGGLARLPLLLETYQPELVIIELGANDGLRGYPITQMQDNLKQMINLAKAADSEVIILGIQLPPNFGKRYTEPFYNSFASLAKQEDTGYLPFLLDGVAQYQALMQSDGLHPTKEAQPRILENVLPVVKQALDMP